MNLRAHLLKGTDGGYIGLWVGTSLVSVASATQATTSGGGYERQSTWTEMTAQIKKQKNFGPARTKPSQLDTCDVENFVADTFPGVQTAFVSLVHAFENLLPGGRKGMFASG
jgi:hypothetical protein